MQFEYQIVTKIKRSEKCIHSFIFELQSKLISWKKWHWLYLWNLHLFIFKCEKPTYVWCCFHFDFYCQNWPYDIHKNSLLKKATRKENAKVSCYKQSREIYVRSMYGVKEMRFCLEKERKLFKSTSGLENV